MGMLYFIDLVFVLLGLTALAKSKGKAKYLVLWWLLIAPIPAALSRDSVSSVRALPMVIPLVILASLGIEEMICWMKGKSKILLVTCRLGRASLLAGCLLFVICYSWHLAYYFDQYYVHRAKKYSRTMQYGYKEVVDFVTQNFHENYKRIIVTQHYGQPHIYWLFYTQYNPKKYQQQSHLTESPVGDVGEIEKIDNIEFRDIYWPDDRSLEKTLVIGSEFELPLKDIEAKQARLLREIKFLDGSLAFRIVETL